MPVLGALFYAMAHVIIREDLLERSQDDLPIYLEVDRIPPAFGLRGLPTSWLVDRGGRIVLLRHGEAVWDTDEVEAFVREMATR